jgi:hypothetical protein
MTADPLLGLLVALPDVCRACGTRNAIVGESKGPHRAGLRCEECTMHRGWLGSTTHTFLVEVVTKFGRSDQPIDIKRGGNTQNGKAAGFISSHSFQASSPNTATQTTVDRAPLAVNTEDMEAESNSNSDGEDKCPWD